MELDAGQRRWLEEHSLDELQAQFKRASLKMARRKECSSQFRGVSKWMEKWQAQFRVRIDGKQIFILNQIFESEQDAARAYDHATLKHKGR